MGAGGGGDDGGRAAGLRMPAEWAPHERTLIAWPAREASVARDDDRAAREGDHVPVVAAIAAFEPVTLVVDPAHVDDARGA